MGLWPQDFCFATRKNNDQLIEQLNRGLGRIKRTGEYQALYEQWMIQPPSDWIIKHKDSVISIGLALLAILFIIVLWFIREVKHKNKIQQTLNQLEKSEKNIAPPLIASRMVWWF